jgi:hypothetical protein
MRFASNKSADVQTMLPGLMQWDAQPTAAVVWTLSFLILEMSCQEHTATDLLEG